MSTSRSNSSTPGKRLDLKMAVIENALHSVDNYLGPVYSVKSSLIKTCMYNTT